MLLRLVIAYTTFGPTISVDLEERGQFGLVLSTQIIFLYVFPKKSYMVKNSIIFKHLWTNMEFGGVTKILFSKCFSQEFIKHFKEDPNNNVQLAVPLSRDISDEENAWLTKDSTMEEV